MPDQDQGLWRHVADLRPHLRPHVRVLVQDYRGERWYLLHDESAGRFLRFNATAYDVIGRLDGDLTMQEIHDAANTGNGADESLTTDDVLQILAQLHGAEVLRGGLPLSAQDALNRYQSQRGRGRRALSNPLALRIPLFDPNRLLNRMLPLARLLFSWTGLWLWSGIVGLAGLLAIVHGDALAADIASKTLTPSEVLVFWILFPIVKALHELGHGLAVKAWGGDVHETGINLLVFMPVPYVDASAASAFRDKRRRALVGAAGILVELFLAAVGLLTWLAVEPGLVREIALNVALIGGVSTFLFNGNPLLRFDGYYVLEDLAEIPGLATRSSRYYLYLIQRYLLGLVDARSPVTAAGERGWFTVYGLAAPLYRLTILLGIALYLAGEFLVVGVVLACWAVLMQVGKPLYQSVRFIATSARLEARRFRAVGVAVAASGLVLAVSLLPAPLITSTEGVVWLDEDGLVHSEVDGFVADVMIASGAEVTPGDLLVRLEDPELIARREALDARLVELRAQQAAERERSRVRAAMVADDIAAVTAELEQVSARQDALDVRSRTAGRFFLHDPHGLRGRFVHHGERLGYVIETERPVVRAVLEQDRIGLLRTRDTKAEVVLAGREAEPIAAEVLREVPAGSTALPSTALGALGGGAIAVDGQDESGQTATEKIFQFDMMLPPGTDTAGIGGRVYVRLVHGAEPLWRQWTRSLRQLLLSRLQV